MIKKLIMPLIFMFSFNSIEIKSVPNIIEHGLFHQILFALTNNIENFLNNMKQCGDNIYDNRQTLLTGALGAAAGICFTEYMFTKTYTFKNNISERFDNIVLNSHAIQSMKKRADCVINPGTYINMGVIKLPQILLYGKSLEDQKLLAQALAGETNSLFISVGQRDLLGTLFSSQKNITKLFDQARKSVAAHQGSVIIFVDNISDCYDFSNLKFFLKEVSDISNTDRITVVFGLKTDDNANDLSYWIEKTNSEFEIEIKPIFVGSLDTESRIKMLNKTINESNNYKHNLTEADFVNIAKSIENFNHKDLKGLLNRAALIAAENQVEVISKKEFFDAISEMMNAKKNEHIYSDSRYQPVTNIQTRFTDVAGLPEAIKSLKRLGDMIQNPAKYKAMGAKLPKGILLYGPPGTGKTLLAQAVAGELDCSLIVINTPEILNMFLGESEAIIKAIFDSARCEARDTEKHCIIFFDEIDSLAGKRSNNARAMNSILEALLVQMDGFSKSNIIVIGTTNRVKDLDDAILRPGRFDEKIYVGEPDEQGRADILDIYMKRIQHTVTQENMRRIILQTGGFSGAELANLVNRAATIALEKGLTLVTITELQDAYDQIVLGVRNESVIISEKNKRITAYHESGHALMLLLFPEMNKEFNQITICPRGNALGYVDYIRKDQHAHVTKEDILHYIMFCLGGRAAEELIFGAVSTGASQDFKQATEVALDMICKYGMTEEFGMVARKEDSDSKEVNDLIKKILDELYLKVKNLLRANRDKMDLLVEALLKKDTLNAEEVYELLGITPPSKNQQV
jgi:cell division protease FtsH